MHQQAECSRGIGPHAREPGFSTGALDQQSSCRAPERVAVVLEDLNVKGLSRTKASTSVHDAGWAMLRFQLTYKARWQRKHLVQPGGKLCLFWTKDEGRKTNVARSLAFVLRLWSLVDTWHGLAPGSTSRADEETERVLDRLEAEFDEKLWWYGAPGRRTKYPPALGSRPARTRFKTSKRETFYALHTPTPIPPTLL